MGNSVCILAPLWSKLPRDGYGGIEKTTLQRANSLNQNGFRIQLIGNVQKIEYAESILNPQKIFKYPSNNLELLKWYSSLGFLKYIREFNQFSNEVWNCPIISDAPTFDLVSSLILKNSFSGRPVVFILHGNIGLTNGHFTKFYKYNRIINGVGKKMWLGALNTNLHNLLQKRGFQSFYLPNGISIPKTIYQSTNLEEYLIFVGAINSMKAPHLAIKAARITNTPLKIIGPITDLYYFKEHIEPYIGDQIKYLGVLTREELDKELRNSKAMLYTSQWNDPQPAVILEAMSNGVPVISMPAFDKIYSGAFDMIVDGINGIQCSISEISKRYKDLEKISKREVLEFTRKNWSWDSVLRKFHIPVLEYLLTHG